MRPYGQRPPHSSLHGSDCGVCSPADVEPARARRSAADEIAEGLLLADEEREHRRWQAYRRACDAEVRRHLDALAEIARRYRP